MTDGITARDKLARRNAVEGSNNLLAALARFHARRGHKDKALILEKIWVRNNQVIPPW